MKELAESKSDLIFGLRRHFAHERMDGRCFDDLILILILLLLTLLLLFPNR